LRSEKPLQASGFFCVFRVVVSHALVAPRMARYRTARPHLVACLFRACGSIARRPAAPIRARARRKPGDLHAGALKKRGFAVSVPIETVLASRLLDKVVMRLFSQ